MIILRIKFFGMSPTMNIEKFHIYENLPSWADFCACPCAIQRSKKGLLNVWSHVLTLLMLSGHFYNLSGHACHGHPILYLFLPVYSLTQ